MAVLCDFIYKGLARLNGGYSNRVIITDSAIFIEILSLLRRRMDLFTDGSHRVARTVRVFRLSLV